MKVSGVHSKGVGGGSDGGDATVRHLRVQGSYLHKRTTPQHLALVSTKGDVDEIPDNWVTEAYGTEYWPQLLHSLRDGDDELQKRVLVAMVSVLKLPQNVAMCLKLDLLEQLERSILSENHEIQEIATHALSVMAESPLGRSQLMASDTVNKVLEVFTATKNTSTLQHLYDALLSVARSFMGAALLSKNGYLPVVVGHLKRSLSDDLRLRVLQLLKYLVNDGIETTAFKALELECIELCANHLYDSKFATRVAACDAIAALGYVEKARKVAVDKGAVKKLCNLLTDAQWRVTAASAGALMCLLVNDDAKRMLVTSDGLQTINQLLQSPRHLVQLNTVKMVAVIASYPPARHLLNVSSTEYHLRTLMAEPDALLAKSAKIALHAVQWQA